MNYLKVYCNLIRKAENRTLPEGYIEKHHTFPKGLFGNNNRIVILTAREHYIAHLLLEKICIRRYGVDNEKTKKMTLACFLMRNRSEKYNSHLYEQLRQRYSDIMKERMGGENNPSYGVPCSEERKQKIREKHLGRKVSQETRDRMSRTRTGKRRGNYLKIYDLDFRDNFIEIVKTSHSKNEILRRFEYKISYRCVTGWIKQLELDTSHFTNVGIKRTDETKEKIRLSKLGEKNPFYGKTHSNDTRRKLSENAKGENNSFYGKKHTNESKKKQSQSKMGHVWWNNGEIEKKKVKCPGDGWVRGKIKK
jgi:hypothetical protein